MLIDISSDGIQKYLYLYGIHEPESTRVYSEIIPKDAIVVDIGANIGYFALIEARRAQKVYAIEPEPNNIELLRKNIALNSYEDVIEVHQFAVSDKTGKAKLAISDIPNHHRLQMENLWMCQRYCLCVCPHGDAQGEDRRGGREDHESGYR